ncbi:MAG: ATP-binding cassette domain-containing protein [Verrucomicrobiota bacterium]
MIHVKDLTKRYAGRTAIDAVSFEVEKGEIVGFLGPNGAGKTTTLRILTNYLPPTSGSATIGGYDIFKDSLGARRIIGYMPENVPLYNDMRVREYLRFRGALRGLSGKALRAASREVQELCGLDEVRKNLIGSLSKGFRQRVGLADALLHKPDLLILDEPTNGLDPNQIRQVRSLIKDLGEKHTVLISTHILPEVEMTCDRVIIINRGRVRAADTPHNLMQNHRGAGTVRLEIKAPAAKAGEALRAISGVKKADRESGDDGWQSYVLRVEGKKDVREAIYHLAAVEKWPVRELTRKTATLEDVFAAMTLTENH